MSDEAPPAYAPISAPSEGTNVPPPQYSADATSAPAAGTAPQQNVQYVNQYGQPVQVAPVQQAPVQQSNVQYVNQYGQPIQAPVQAAQPQANVQYVNQYGQPIQAPTATVVAAAPQQANVQYVNQYGQPIAAPTGTVVTTATTTTVIAAPGATNVNDTGQAANTQERNQRIIAFCVGGLGSFLLFVGMCIVHNYIYNILFVYTLLKSKGLCTDSLAAHTWYDYDWYEDITVHCGWTKIWASDSYYYSDIDYGDLCDYNDDACATQAVGIISLLLMLAATICGIWATIIVCVHIHRYIL